MSNCFKRIMKDKERIHLDEHRDTTMISNKELMNEHFEEVNQ